MEKKYQSTKVRKEDQEKNLPFFKKFLIAFPIAFGGIGLGTWLFLGFNFGLTSVILVVILSAVLALIIAAMLNVFKDYHGKRIEKLKNKGDVLRLIDYTYYRTPQDKLEGSLWHKATDAILEIGEPAIPVLIKALNPETCPLVNPAGVKLPTNPKLRLGAAYCLGKIGDNSVLENLEVALNDEDKMVQRYAKRAIEELNK